MIEIATNRVNDIPKVLWQISLIWFMVPHRSGLKKLVYRLIVMFLPTEIFSKRRKIYSWLKRTQSYLHCELGAI